MSMKKIKSRKKVILVDMDGTLSQGVCWTPEECLGAKPNLSVIKKVNELAKEGFIVIWTARRDKLIPATMQWCRKNGVIFHAISNHKAPADIYIDDNCINVADL